MPATTVQPTRRATATFRPTATRAWPPRQPPTSTFTLTPPPTHTVIPSPTRTPRPTATPDPYAALSINALRARSYGGGEVFALETMEANSYFTRTLIAYPSDELSIFGFMDVPVGTGPFPVVIAIHGYIDPTIYTTLDYTTKYADSLARAGFLVLHPNLRGYRPSDSGDNLFRVGMAIDVLNLIALVKEQGGKPGALAKANPAAIGLWGHSMGGGIATRVMTVSPDVDAVVLYAAMSGDEKLNYTAIDRWTDSMLGQEELQAPESAFERISPVNFLQYVRAAVSVHQGLHDELVPPAWASSLCSQLKALEKPLECFTYPSQKHTFSGADDTLFKDRVIDFFTRTLGGG